MRATFSGSAGNSSGAPKRTGSISGGTPDGAGASAPPRLIREWKIVHSLPQCGLVKYVREYMQTSTRLVLRDSDRLFGQSAPGSMSSPSKKLISFFGSAVLDLTSSTRSS